MKKLGLILCMLFSLNFNNKGNDQVISIIILGEKYENIGNLTYFDVYNGDGIYNFKNIKHTNTKRYCLYKNKYLETQCKLEGYKIVKGKIIKKNYLINVKKNLKNNYIFVFKPSDELEDELNIIFRYVRNKGYKIVKLEKIL